MNEKNINKNISLVTEKIKNYFGSDEKRINHFLKVLHYGQVISNGENTDENLREVIVIACIVHDIGIKNSEKKYKSSSGKYQEIEGPGEARKLLSSLNFQPEFIDRVCYLVGHHHSYNCIDGLDFQILVEADFLVNIQEENMTTSQIKTIKKKIFKTATGLDLLKKLYGA